MTLPDGIKDLKYVIDRSVPDNPVANFTTTTLEQKDGANTQCTANQHPLGAMWRTSDDPKLSGAQYAASKAVGSFFVLYDTSAQGCSSDRSTVDLQSSQAILLKQALNTATVVN
jgi:hypothetical protein